MIIYYQILFLLLSKNKYVHISLKIATEVYNSGLFGEI